MKPARPRTRAVVKLLLQTDSEVDARQMKLVMDILEGNPPPGVYDDSPIPHVIHRRQIMEVLGCCSRTVDNLAAKKLLVPVLGIGKKVIGYTEDSLRRLAEGRAPKGKEAADGRE